jgi:hypothetical protein
MLPGLGTAKGFPTCGYYVKASTLSGLAFVPVAIFRAILTRLFMFKPFGLRALTPTEEFTVYSLQFRI